MRTRKKTRPSAQTKSAKGAAQYGKRNRAKRTRRFPSDTRRGMV